MPPLTFETTNPPPVASIQTGSKNHAICPHIPPLPAQGRLYLPLHGSLLTSQSLLVLQPDPQPLNPPREGRRSILPPEADTRG